MSQEKEIERSLPLHLSIAKSIQRDVVERGLSADTKISSEVVLAEQYRVSRGTITKAIDSLVRQGILYRQRPQGTFVASPAMSIQPLEILQPPLRTLSPVIQAVVGIVIPHFPDSFLGNILLGVETLTRAAGYSLSFAYSENDLALERYHIEQFLQREVAGIVIIPSDYSVEQQDGHLISVGSEEQQEMLRALQQRGVPFVLIDRYIPEVQCDYVISDDRTAGYAATQHLLSLGHQRIGFISTSPHITSIANRYLGYVQCVQEYNLPLDETLILNQLRQSSPLSMPGGIPTPDLGQADLTALCRYLQSSERPDAIVAVNEYVALRVLQAAEAVSLNIPEDLALVSCGSGELGAHARVPLTSILQAPAELGRQATHILLDRITHSSSRVRQVIIPVTLVVRKSSGALQPKVPLSITHQNN